MPAAELENGKQFPGHNKDHFFDAENQLTTRHEIDFPSMTQTKTFGYDANGSQTSSTDLGTVKVDIENRIYESGNWRYRYDPFGRRVEKRQIGGQFWRYYYYDGVQCIQDWEVCAIHGDDDGCLSAPFWTRIYGPYLVDQILWGRWDHDSDIGTISDYFYFHLDFLGTVVMLTTDTGSTPTIAESYRYDEYGQGYYYGPNGGSPLGGSDFEQDKLYTGRRWDEELELYHNRQRYMSSVAGRFASRDPLSTDVHANLYSYVNLNPVQLVDPFGLQAGFIEDVRTGFAWVGILGLWEAHTANGIAFRAKLLADSSGLGSVWHNAFKHCLLACMLRKSYDRATTDKLLRAREDVETEDFADSLVDDWNNKWGIWCAETHVPKPFDYSGCYDCCAKLIVGGGTPRYLQERERRGQTPRTGGATPPTGATQPGGFGSDGPRVSGPGLSPHGRLWVKKPWEHRGQPNEGEAGPSYYPEEQDHLTRRISDPETPKCKPKFDEPLSPFGGPGWRPGALYH